MSREWPCVNQDDVRLRLIFAPKYYATDNRTGMTVFKVPGANYNDNQA